MSDAAVVGGERTKVLDFGIAKMGPEAQKDGNGNQTSYRAILGTPRYMSPEQCRGAGQVAAESDVYSLGIMLYEMLTGQPPFAGEEMVMLMTAHLTAEPRPLRHVTSDVPAEVAGLVHEMLIKSAADRPTMREVEQRLGELIARVGAIASSPPAPREPSIPDSARSQKPVPPIPATPPTTQPKKSEPPVALFRSQTPGYIWTDGIEPGPENLERVLVFIPIFEDTSRSFYEPNPRGHQGYDFGPEVMRFIQVAIEQGLICDSYAVPWLNSKAAIYRSYEAIDTADLYACQRLLTAFVDDNPQLAIKLNEALDQGLVLRVLYRLRAIRDEMLSGQRRIREDGQIQLLLGDLGNMGIDAVVCSSEETLGGSGRLERYIRERGGPDMVAACQRIGGCPTGEARVVNGYRLPAGRVIFTIGPAWRGGQRGEEAALARCYQSCLEMADNIELHTLAFPAISTGVDGFPPERAARVAVDSVRRHFLKNPDDALWKVYFVCYDEAMFSHYETALRAPPPVDKPATPEVTPPRVDAKPRIEPKSEEKKAPAPAAFAVPNPEFRNIGTFLTHELLINCLFSQVTLEAFRLSRALINDPASNLEQLDQMIIAWLAAHENGPTAELEQLSRWKEGKLDGPTLLNDLCDRMAILAYGALGWQQPSCLYGFRVFLRALRDSYVLQAKLFGLESKLSRKAGAGNPHKPKARELPDTWAAVYLGSIVSYRAPRVLQAELISFEASAAVKPLSPADAALHLRIARNLSIGVSTLAGSGDDFFLVVGYMGSLDRYYHLRVHTGATELVSRDKWRGGQVALDYVLLDDSDANQDGNKYDLSPADPQSS